jgi:hypothetical protein
MTRSLSTIRTQAALALAITAVAVPSAFADGPTAPISLVTPDARDAGRPALIDRVSPDARDAGRPAAAIDRVSPDARDNGRRETPPVVVQAPALAHTDGFNWLDAGIGAGGLAALLLLGAGTATTVRTRRGPVGAA